MFWLDTSLQALLQGLLLCVKVTAIVWPLTFLYELAEVYRVFERPWPRLGRVMSAMGMSKQSVLPLLAGIFQGLTYGAGILVGISRDGKLEAGERLALMIFLATCHAVIEDVAIFVLLGGSAVLMLLPRLVLAVGLTMLAVPRRRGAAAPETETTG